MGGVPARPRPRTRQAARTRLRRAAPGLPALLLTAAAGACSGPPAPEPVPWWKGNLHTHSLWSDGADFPEMIAEWYRARGYHFVAFTEHDMLQEGERWVDVEAPDEGWPPRNRSARRALPAYRQRFGGEWVEERVEGERHLVRLKPLAEHRSLFEEPGRFLLLTGEEVTDADGAHVNVLNLEAALQPAGGDGPSERIRNNLDSVAARRRAGARPLLAIVNHPNFLWALTAEDLAGIPEARFLEVFSGHLHVNNEGDAQRAGTERIWDAVLALRHAAGAPPIFGVAADDAHEYRAHGDTVARPGRAWVVVRAPQLTPEHLLAAMEEGDFYASTGVTLRDVRRDPGRLRVEVEPDPGAAYRTLFIGTREGALEGHPVVGPEGDTLRTTRAYGPALGEVLAEVEGAVAEYELRGDERYVRAKVVSSRPHVDPTTGRVLGRQAAWVQPVVR